MKKSSFILNLADNNNEESVKEIFITENTEQNFERLILQ